MEDMQLAGAEMIDMRKNEKECFTKLSTLTRFSIQ